MAFIQLQAEPDNPDKAYLVNTDHITTVKLTAYDGTDAVSTHVIKVSVSGELDFAAYFTSLETAQSAYNKLTTYLNPDATTIQLY